jgi:hypothetical protein
MPSTKSTGMTTAVLKPKKTPTKKKQYRISEIRYTKCSIDQFSRIVYNIDNGKIITLPSYYKHITSYGKWWTYSRKHYPRQKKPISIYTMPLSNGTKDDWYNAYINSYDLGFEHLSKKEFGDYFRELVRQQIIIPVNPFDAFDDLW